MDKTSLGRLYLDVRRLSERVDFLEHENASLRDALERSDMLKFDERFWAGVHRRRFAAAVRRQPCSFETSLSDALRVQSITHAIADCFREASVCAACAPSRSSPEEEKKAGDAKEQKQSKSLSLAPGEADSVIYVFGGNDDAKTLNSCERYLPATNSWETLASMSQARSAAAAALFEGRIYVCGGNHCGQTLNHVEMYDPAKGVWEIMPTLLKGRSACSLAGCANKLYVCGGWSGKQALASCERFDSRTRSWENIAPMVHRREWPVITVDDNQLYVCGGQDGSEDVSAVECFDPKTSGWETLPLKVQCRRNAAVAVVSSQLYLCGGHGHDGRHVLNTVERFNPQKSVWEPVSPMQTNRRNAMAKVIAGRIYVFGGRGSRGNHNHGGGHALRTGERFDPIAGTWDPIPPMAARRYRAAAVVSPLR